MASSARPGTTGQSPARRLPSARTGEVFGVNIALVGEVRRVVRLLLRGLLLGAALALGSAQAQQPAGETRLALVIGNSAYKQSPLANAVADARLMDKVLRESGFEVVRAENATLRDMRRLVRDFGERLQRSKGVGLFYFAGHGVQVRGENYLVSIDSDIRSEDEVPDDSVSAQLILEKLESAQNRMNIIVLDACRNNPFASRTRSSASGLATMNAPAGTLVAYATAPGAVAYDGSGSNSLYTRHLAEAIRKPGLRVEEVFKLVRAAVRRSSNNQQTPWENTALEGEFYFRTPPAAPAPTAAVAAAAAPAAQAPTAAAFELAFWDSIKTSQQKTELEEYLRQFPQGRFAGLARSRLTALERSVVPAPRERPVETSVAALQPTPPAAAPPTAPAQTVSAAFAALGDRLLFRDSDPFSGVDARDFARVVTKASGEEIEFDGGLLTLGRGAGRVKGNSHAELVSSPVRPGGSWSATYFPAAGQGAAVQLQLRFDRAESRTVAGRPLQLVRANVSGFGPNTGIPGRATSFNAAIRGHAVLEPESGIVVEMNLVSDNPPYALRRQLLSIEPARR